MTIKATTMIDRLAFGAVALASVLVLDGTFGANLHRARAEPDARSRRVASRRRVRAACLRRY